MLRGLVQPAVCQPFKKLLGCTRRALPLISLSFVDDLICAFRVQGLLLLGSARLAARFHYFFTCNAVIFKSLTV